MTDTQLLRALAQIMGWEVVGPELNRRAHYDFSGPHIFQEIDGTFWRGIKADGNCIVPWKPLHDMNDAWMIIQKLRAAGWYYELDGSHHSDEHCARFGRGEYDRHDDTWEIEYSVCAPTPQRAIALAALRAFGVEVAK